MNHARRDELAKLQERFNTAWADAQDMLTRMNETFSVIRDEVDTIKTEEEDCFHALNEGLQAAARGQQMEAAVEAMQEIYDTLDSMVTGLDDIGNLPDAEVNANFDKAMG